jgi:hypothetical protein
VNVPVVVHFMCVNPPTCVVVTVPVVAEMTAGRFTTPGQP